MFFQLANILLYITFFFMIITLDYLKLYLSGAFYLLMYFAIENDDVEAIK